MQPRTKRLQIAYMPRKRPLEAAFLRGICHNHPRMKEIPWIPLDGLSESRVAEILGESAVFLALGNLEGLGLPPLEAMACRCLVVGYHAYGGLEYATPANGLWLDPLDPSPPPQPSSPPSNVSARQTRR